MPRRRDYHGRDPGERWPAGSPDDASGDGQGGRFRRTGSGGVPAGDWAEVVSARIAGESIDDRDESAVTRETGAGSMADLARLVREHGAIDVMMRRDPHYGWMPGDHESTPIVITDVREEPGPAWAALPNIGLTGLDPDSDLPEHRRDSIDLGVYPGSWTVRWRMPWDAPEGQQRTASNISALLGDDFADVEIQQDDGTWISVAADVGRYQGRPSGYISLRARDGGVEPLGNYREGDLITARVRELTEEERLARELGDADPVDVPGDNEGWDPPTNLTAASVAENAANGYGAQMWNPDYDRWVPIQIQREDVGGRIRYRVTDDDDGFIENYAPHELLRVRTATNRTPATTPDTPPGVEWRSGGSWPPNDVAALFRQTGDVQIRNSRGEWDRVASVDYLASDGQYRFVLENDGEIFEDEDNNILETRILIHTDSSPTVAVETPLLPAGATSEQWREYDNLILDNAVEIVNDPTSAVAALGLSLPRGFDHDVFRNWVTQLQSLRRTPGAEQDAHRAAMQISRLAGLDDSPWIQQMMRHRLGRGPAPSTVSSQRQEYNDEVADAVRLAVEAGRMRLASGGTDRAAAHTAFSVLEGDYGVEAASLLWDARDSSGTAFLALSNSYDDYLAQVAAGDLHGASETIDGLAAYTGLDDIFIAPTEGASIAAPAAGADPPSNATSVVMHANVETLVRHRNLGAEVAVQITTPTGPGWYAVQFHGVEHDGTISLQVADIAHDDEPWYDFEPGTPVQFVHFDQGPEQYEATAADLAAGLYGSPGELEILIPTGWELVRGWDNDGSLVDILTWQADGTEGSITRTPGQEITWRPRPPGVTPRPLPRQQVAPPTPPAPQVSPLHSWNNPPAGELPGGAATLREMMEVLQAAQLGWASLTISPELKRRIEQIFAYTDPSSGLEARITTIELSAAGRMAVGGRVYDQNGRDVGNWSRNLDADGNVYHAYFRLNPDIQGDGFTTRWFEQVLDGYRAEGMSKVAVSANIDVGGYTWSRWFDFADPGRARMFLEQMLAAVDQRWYQHVTPDTKQEIEDLITRLENGGRVTAREVSQVGYSRRQRINPPDGYESNPQDWDSNADWIRDILPRRGSGTPIEMWLGKHFMLGKSWAGVLEL